MKPKASVILILLTPFVLWQMVSADVQSEIIGFIAVFYAINFTNLKKYIPIKVRFLIIQSKNLSVFLILDAP